MRFFVKFTAVTLVVLCGLTAMNGCDSNVKRAASGSFEKPAEEKFSSVDPINLGWRFSKGEQSGAIDPSFDDSGWELVNLPHDWAISEPFDPEGNPDTAKLPWKGEGWYRKRFRLPAEDEGRRLQFVFDGVMASPTVYLNGKEVGSWVYGYNSFWVDATDAAQFGHENTLVIHADTRDHRSRWYPGAGVYRKISMRIVDPIHIPVWGVYVTTPVVEEASAKVRAKVELSNGSGRAETVRVESEILDPNGVTVTAGHEEVLLRGEEGEVVFDLRVENPLRWDIEHPYLYTLRTRVLKGGEEVDTEVTTFGIRTFKWTADDGFHLNGRRVNLQGVNEHHTHGLLGAAFFPRAMERKLEMLKDMGINALRTSHNPEAPEVLEMCDRLGIIVINELYDKWDNTAGVPVSTAEYVNNYAEREVKNFVLRDRNHPSVVIWSIANEDYKILYDRDGNAAQHVNKMVSFFERYDPSRPTLKVAHIPQGADRSKHIFDNVDVSGWNYSSRYTNFRENYPEKPILYAETASAFGTRGYYNLELPDAKTDYKPGPYQSNYGLTAAAWADIPEHEFERMRKDEFLTGNFVWAGFDYLGEPTPARGKSTGPELSAKARSSYFGIIDLAGLPKDAFYLYRSLWNEENHTVQVSPHWNWSKGDKVPVIVYTDGDEAELFLNGESLGRKAKLDPEDVIFANFAFGQTVNASSSEVVQDETGNVLFDRTPDKAIDGSTGSRWSAENSRFPQEWEVDLGEEKLFSTIVIQWETNASDYDFELLASSTGERWDRIEGRRESVRSSLTISHDPRAARYLKVRILGHRTGAKASIQEFEVYGSDALSNNPYFDIVDAYRIRFFDVPYEPGELKAVAYKDGRRIGESIVRTAGPAAKLDLQVDQAELTADGMDLGYIQVRMLDAHGNLQPLAMNRLKFEVDGPVDFMGVANGDQMGMESLTDDVHPLFYGQAVAVVRSQYDNEGSARVRVSADNGLSAEVDLHVSRP